MNIKKGDKVYVIGTRSTKAKEGKVLAVDTKNETVTVEGYNMITKHVKARSAAEQGGIIKKEGPVHVSNVMVICPSCGKPTRVGHKIVVDGDKKTKVRVCKKCGAEIKTPIDR